MSARLYTELHNSCFDIFTNVLEKSYTKLLYMYFRITILNTNQSSCDFTSKYS